MLETSIKVIETLGLLALFVIAYVYIRHFSFPLQNKLLRDAIAGVLFSFLIVIAMLDPIVIGDAVLDARAGPAVLAGIFAGPIGAFITACTGAYLRFFVIGGPAAVAGAASLAVYGVFGLAVGHLIRARGLKITPASLLVIGFAGYICVLPAFLLAFEPAVAVGVIAKTAPVLIASNVLSTFIIGVFLVQGGRLLEHSQQLESQVALNRRLALIAKETTNGVIVTNMHGETEWVNDSFESLTEYTAEEMAGKAPGDLLQGPETDPETVKRIAHQLAAGKGFDEEIINYTKSGKAYWVKIHCEPFVDVDGESKYMALEVDITDTKQTEIELERRSQQLQVVLNNFPGALIFTDDDLRIAFRSERFVDLYMAPPALLEVGAYYPDFLKYLAQRGDYGPGDPDELIKPRVAALRSGEDQSVVDRLPDGHIYGVRRTASPTGGVVTVVTDQTELILLNDQLREASLAAEQASKAKSEFLASMSHEIRTPMTGIIGFTDLLLEEHLPGDSADKVAKIKGLSTALLAILNDILDLSKLDAEKLEIERLPFSLNRLTQDITELFEQTRPESKRDRLGIALDLHPDCPDAVVADPSRLRQVLVNLMGNAVKFTDSGSVTLRVEPDKEPSKLKFSVVDTGIGIDPSAQDRLFEDFVQADSSISRQYQGTGLGLAICKRLVKLMGGEIGLNSTLGEGSEFWFTLPFEVTDEAIDLLHPGASHFEKVPEKAARSLNILVAEDNEINQQIIRSLLEKMGHRSTMADNGAQAVAKVTSDTFDLILMDVRMPELSGPDATRQIRQLDSAVSTIPIIALTADVMAENRESYLKAGMNAVVAKPINRMELERAINKAAGVDSVSLSEQSVEQDSVDSEALMPVFDIDEVVGRLGIGREDLEPVLDEFANQYETSDEKLDQLLDDKDLKGLREYAHTLKGTSSTLGMYDLSALAYKAETEAKTGNFALVQSCIPELKKQTGAAVRSIRASRKCSVGVN